MNNNKSQIMVMEDVHHAHFLMIKFEFISNTNVN